MIVNYFKHIEIHMDQVHFMMTSIEEEQFRGTHKNILLQYCLLTIIVENALLAVVHFLKCN